MAQQWPTTAPSVSPGTHDPVATQAYQAGGGDYFRTGFYSHGIPSVGSFTSTALALSTCYFTPYLVPVRRAFDRIGLQVTTAGTTGALLRLGIYSNVGGIPSSLIVDAGTAPADSISSKELVIATTLDPGLYWLATVAQVAASTVVWFPAGTQSPFSQYRTTPQNASTHDLGKTQTGVTGALPATTGTLSTSGSAPAPMLRAA